MNKNNILTQIFFPEIIMLIIFWLLFHMTSKDIWHKGITHIPREENEYSTETPVYK